MCEVKISVYYERSAIFICTTMPYYPVLKQNTYIFSIFFFVLPRLKFEKSIVEVCHVVYRLIVCDSSYLNRLHRYFAYEVTQYERQRM